MHQWASHYQSRNRADLQSGLITYRKVASDFRSDMTSSVPGILRATAKGGGSHRGAFATYHGGDGTEQEEGESAKPRGKGKGTSLPSHKRFRSEASTEECPLCKRAGHSLETCFWVLYEIDPKHKLLEKAPWFLDTVKDAQKRQTMRKRWLEDKDLKPKVETLICAQSKKKPRRENRPEKSPAKEVPEAGSD
jgi:hypothetical protein